MYPQICPCYRWHFLKGSPAWPRPLHDNSAGQKPMAVQVEPAAAAHIFFVIIPFPYLICYSRRLVPSIEARRPHIAVLKAIIFCEACSALLRPLEFQLRPHAIAQNVLAPNEFCEPATTPYATMDAMRQGFTLSKHLFLRESSAYHTETACARHLCAIHYLATMLTIFPGT